MDAIQTINDVLNYVRDERSIMLLISVLVLLCYLVLLRKLSSKDKDPIWHWLLFVLGVAFLAIGYHAETIFQDLDTNDDYTLFFGALGAELIAGTYVYFILADWDNQEFPLFVHAGLAFGLIICGICGFYSINEMALFPLHDLRGIAGDIGIEFLMIPAIVVPTILLARLWCIHTELRETYTKWQSRLRISLVEVVIGIFFLVMMWLTWQWFLDKSWVDTSTLEYALAGGILTTIAVGTWITDNDLILFFGCITIFALVFGIIMGWVPTPADYEIPVMAELVGAFARAVMLGDV